MAESVGLCGQIWGTRQGVGERQSQTRSVPRACHAFVTQGWQRYHDGHQLHFIRWRHLGERSAVHARCFGPKGPQHDALLRRASAGEGAGTTSEAPDLSHSLERRAGSREFLRENSLEQQLKKGKMQGSLDAGCRAGAWPRSTRDDSGEREKTQAAPSLISDDINCYPRQPGSGGLAILQTGPKESEEAA